MTDYALRVADEEVQRYRLMAARARAEEAELWARGGIVPGAVVADVGCGPAALAVQVAEVVGPGGRVVGVEPDPTARVAAGRLIAESGADNVVVRDGTGTDTGLDAGSVDVAMVRHVLAHNGGAEQRIVDHVASRVRTGGSVYLVDVEATALRTLDADADLDDLTAKYVELHRRRGDDPCIGLRLGSLLQRAGLDLLLHVGRYQVVPVTPGLRPPGWAARDAMVDEGVATVDDVRRWAAAFDRTDAAAIRPTTFVPFFYAIAAKR